MKKHHALLIFMLLVAIVYSLTYLNYLNFKKSRESYTVKKISGRVSYRHQVMPTTAGMEKFKNSDRWFPLQEQMVVMPGDDIKTGENSSVDLWLANDILVRIAENSVVKVEERRRQTSPGPLSFLKKVTIFAKEVQAGDNDTKKQKDFTVQAGKILSGVATTLTKLRNNEPLRINTPYAVVGVRGTHFSVVYDPSLQESTVAVLQGGVSVAAVGNAANEAFVFDRSMAIFSHAVKDLDFSKVKQEPLSPQEQDLIAALAKEDNRTTFGVLIQHLLDLRVFKRIFDDILISLAKYEMRSIVAHAEYSGNAVPDRIQDIKLQYGDFDDPWQKPYRYEKFDNNNGLIQSAGPDKDMYTHDDIVIPIQRSFNAKPR